MKKIFALFLIIVLSVTAFSCSEKSTEESLQENVSECDLTELWKAFNDNPVSAQDVYYGKVIKITGYVKNIYPNYVRVYPVDAPVDDDGFNRLYVNVIFSNDDMKQLSTNSVINCIGKISSVSPINNSQAIVLNEASYIDDTVELQGKASFLRDSNGMNRLMRISKSMMCGDGFVTLIGEYRIQESGTQEDFYSTTIDNRLIQDGDYINIKCKLKYESDGSASETAVFYDITEILSVE